MMSSRRPPLRMPTMPWSQPGMTMPAPSWNGNGWAPRSHEASNCWPVDHEVPTYCMLISSPAFAFGPLPLTMSRITSSGGGSPCGAGISGLVFVSLPIAWTIASTPASEAVSVGVGVAAASSPLPEAGSSSSPQAAIPAESTRARVRVISFVRKAMRRSCGAGTRTPTTRARIWRAANYTTPQRAAPSIGGLTGSARLTSVR